MNDRERSLEKLLTSQQNLRVQEDWLRQAISKCNAQVHALQVEKLHILSEINKRAETNTYGTLMNNTKIDLKKETIESQELDLTVPIYQSSEEDDEIED